MKYLNLFLLILLGMYSNAQQNYFSNRYHYGGAQSGLAVVQNGSNYIIKSAVDGFGVGLKNNFILIDSVGNELFHKIHGVDGYYFYSGGYSGLVQQTDSSYIFAGTIQDSSHLYDAILYKLSKDGDSVWIRQYDDTLFQSGWQAKKCRDGGFVITGGTAIPIASYMDDVLLIKTDSDGNLLWKKNYGLAAGNDLAFSVDTALDGGFIMFGFSNSNGTGLGNQFGDGYVIKVDSLGSIQWSKSFGDIYNDEFWNGITCKDGSFICVGQTAIFDPGYPSNCCNSWNKFYIVKIDFASNTIFEKSYGNDAVGYNALYSVKELSNGDFITAGAKWDTVANKIRGVILKINSAGDSLWMHTYENLHGPHSDNYLYDISPTSDGGYILTGEANPFPPDTGTQDIWVLKIDSEGCEIANCLFSSVSEYSNGNLSKSLRNYPNPYNISTTIEVRVNENLKSPKLLIYDIVGNVIAEYKLSIGLNAIPILSGTLPAGTYFYSLVSANKKIETEKMICTY